MTYTCLLAQKIYQKRGFLPFNNNIPLEKASGVCLKNSHIHSHKWVLHPQNSHSKNKSLHLEKELNICKRTKEKKHSCCHFPS